MQAFISAPLTPFPRALIPRGRAARPPGLQAGVTAGPFYSPKETKAEARPALVTTPEARPALVTTRPGGHPGVHLALLVFAPIFLRRGRRRQPCLPVSVFALAERRRRVTGDKARRVTWQHRVHLRQTPASVGRIFVSAGPFGHVRESGVLTRVDDSSCASACPSILSQAGSLIIALVSASVKFKSSK